MCTYVLVNNLYAKIIIYNRNMYDNENIFNIYNNIYRCKIPIKVPADLPARLQKSYGQQHSFQILSTFLYDFCIGLRPADFFI